MLTSPVAPMALSSLLRGPMTAGAPIFLAPRLPSSMTAVTSMPSNMLSAAPSPMMSTADGSSYFYQYDPFVQPVFEYSTAYEQSTPGKSRLTNLLIDCIFMGFVSISLVRIKFASYNSTNL